MALTKFLARDLTIEVSTGVGTDTIAGTTDDTWTPIKGLNSLTHSPGSSDVDTTDFDSDGHAEHMKAERSESWALAGFSLEDVTTGARDPGQLAVETLGRAMGPASLGWFRITSPGGNRIVFQASAEVTLAGGGNNDAAAWEVSLTVSGEPDYEAAP